MTSSNPSVVNMIREGAHNLGKSWPRAVVLLGVAIAAVSVCTAFVSTEVSLSNGDWITGYSIERLPIHWLIWAALAALGFGWWHFEKLTTSQIRLLTDSGVCLAVALYGYGIHFALTVRKVAQAVGLGFGMDTGGFAYFLGCLLIFWISFDCSRGIRKLEKTES